MRIPWLPIPAAFVTTEPDRKTPSADKEPARILVLGEDLKELKRLARAFRVAEFEKAMADAIAALPSEPEFRVIQGRDGMWRAERRGLYVYPPAYEVRAAYISPYAARPAIVPPEADKIHAAWEWTPFAPTFNTAAEARKWLKDYLKPPTPKVIGFDKEGNEQVAAEAPPIA